MQDSEHRVRGYEIVGRIGRGGMGTVHLARQTRLDRLVALKELAELDALDPLFSTRFQREARLAASLDHPNIVVVYDYFEENRRAYISMEYVEGGSLRPLVGRLTTPQIGGVLGGILSGLAHSEARGIVHRDLKPENLLVAKRGTVKIADFGIAKATNQASLTATGMAVGSPTYMAPEQATGSPVGPWTDLYAAGMIAYELLAGRLPFAESDTPGAILWKQVNEPLLPPLAMNPALDARLAQWVEWLLAKESGRRPAGAAVARRALEDILTEVAGPRWRAETRIEAATPKPVEAAAATPSRPDAAARPEPEPESDYVTFRG